MHSEQTQRCNCPHHMLIPVFVALIGITFFLQNLELLTAHTAGIIWPALVALAGLQLLFSRRCKCHGEHGHCNHCHHCMHDGKPEHK